MAFQSDRLTVILNQEQATRPRMSLPSQKGHRMRNAWKSLFRNLSCPGSGDEVQAVQQANLAGSVCTDTMERNAGVFFLFFLVLAWVVPTNTNCVVALGPNWKTIVHQPFELCESVAWDSRRGYRVDTPVQSRRTLWTVGRKHRTGTTKKGLGFTEIRLPKIAWKITTADSNDFAVVDPCGKAHRRKKKKEVRDLWGRRMTLRTTRKSTVKQLRNKG